MFGVPEILFLVAVFLTAGLPLAVIGFVIWFARRQVRKNRPPDPA